MKKLDKKKLRNAYTQKFNKEKNLNKKKCILLQVRTVFLKVCFPQKRYVSEQMIHESNRRTLQAANAVGQKLLDQWTHCNL